MKDIVWHFVKYSSLLIYVSLVMGCGGIEGTGGTVDGLESNLPIIAYGPITELDGMVVNGVVYGSDFDSVNINHETAEVNQLALGHVLLINRRQIEEEDFATQVDYLANIRGPIESVDAENNKLTVLGQSVTVSEETHFGEELSFSEIDSLLEGQLVEISGFSTSEGKLIATRFSLANELQPDQLSLTGIISNLATEDSQFSINGLTVDYSLAGVQSYPYGEPENGLRVFAQGSLNNDETLQATEVIFQPILPDLSEGQRLDISALISRYASPTDFDLAGISVTAIASDITYINGEEEDLRLNAAVNIKGSVDEMGRLVATSIRFLSLTAED